MGAAEGGDLTTISPAGYAAPGTVDIIGGVGDTPGIELDSFCELSFPFTIRIWGETTTGGRDPVEDNALP